MPHRNSNETARTKQEKLSDRAMNKKRDALVSAIYYFIVEQVLPLDDINRMLPLYKYSEYLDFFIDQAMDVSCRNFIYIMNTLHFGDRQNYVEKLVDLLVDYPEDEDLIKKVLGKWKNEVIKCGLKDFYIDCCLQLSASKKDEGIVHYGVTSKYIAVKNCIWNDHIHVMKKVGAKRCTNCCKYSKKKKQCRFCLSRFCDDSCFIEMQKDKSKVHKTICQAIAPFVHIEKYLLEKNVIVLSPELVDKVDKYCCRSQKFREITESCDKHRRKTSSSLDNNRKLLEQVDSSIKNNMIYFKPVLPDFWKMVIDNDVYKTKLSKYISYLDYIAFSLHGTVSILSENIQ